MSFGNKGLIGLLLLCFLSQGLHAEPGMPGAAAAAQDTQLARERLSRLLDGLLTCAERFETADAAFAKQIRASHDEAHRLGVLSRLDIVTEKIERDAYLDASNDVGHVIASIDRIREILQTPPARKIPDTQDAKNKIQETDKIIGKQTKVIQNAELIDALDTARKLYTDLGKIEAGQSQINAALAGSDQEPVMPKPVTPPNDPIKALHKVKVRLDNIETRLDEFHNLLLVKESNDPNADPEEGSRISKNVLNSAKQAGQGVDRATNGLKNNNPSGAKKQGQAAINAVTDSKNRLKRLIDNLKAEANHRGGEDAIRQGIADQQGQIEQEIKRLRDQTGDPTGDLGKAQAAAQKAQKRFLNTLDPAKPQSPPPGDTKSDEPQGKLDGDSSGKPKDPLTDGIQQANNTRTALEKTRENTKDDLKNRKEEEAVLKAAGVIQKVLEQQRALNVKARNLYAKEQEQGPAREDLRLDQFDIADLSDLQRELAKILVMLAKEMPQNQTSVVVPWWLHQISRDMGAVANQVFNPDEGVYNIGTTIQDRQVDIRIELEELLKVLEEKGQKIADARNNKEKSQSKNQSGNNKPPQKPGGDEDAKKPLASLPVEDLRALRFLEERLRDQTLRFHETRKTTRAAEQPDPWVERLRAEQSDILRLSRQLSRQVDAALETQASTTEE